MSKYALAFYIGSGKPFDRLIRVVTGEAMTHVEFVDLGNVACASAAEYPVKCYSSSPRDGGVREKRMKLSSARWLLVPIMGHPKKIARQRQTFKHYRYDYLTSLAAALGWRLPPYCKRINCVDYCAHLISEPRALGKTPYQLYQLVTTQG